MRWLFVPVIFLLFFSADAGDHSAYSQFFALPSVTAVERTALGSAQNLSAIRVQPLMNSVRFFIEPGKSGTDMSGWVLDLFDCAGRKIRSLRNQYSDGSGIEWDMKTETGNKVGEGIYLCRLSGAARKAAKAFPVIR